MRTALLLVLLATPSFAQQNPIDDAVSAEMKSTKTSGVAVAVVRGNDVIYAKGFGTAKGDGAAITADTVFELGSLTKTFTAATVLTYAERKIVDLHAPLQTYVPLPGCLGTATLDQLLSHTAGLRDEPDETGPDTDSAMAEFVRSWQADDFCLIAPGSAFSYSNAGYTLAGFALQQAAKTPFPDAVGAAVLAPLKMTHSGFRVAAVSKLPLAGPISEDSRQWPAGGLFSSANDVARFAIAFMNGGLPANVVRSMMSPHARIAPLRQQYGYGLFLDGEMVEHAGSNPGYTALLRMMRSQKCAVIVLANNDAFMRATAQTAMEFCQGAAAPPPARLSTTPIPPGDMAKYEGVYTQPKRWSIDVTRRGDRLMLSQFGREFELLRIEGDRLAFSPFPAAPPKEVDVRPDLLQEDIWAFKKAPVSEGDIRTPDGATLHYQKIGNAPLTLIVPLGFILYDDFKALADTATVIAYDMRNRGRSSHAKEVNMLTIQQDVKDLETVRAHFGLDKFVPIGFSYLGLMVAMYAADDPQHVSRLVQIDPVAMKFGAQYPKELSHGFDDIGAPEAAVQRYQARRANPSVARTEREACEIDEAVFRYVLVGNPASATRVKSVCDLENEWPANLNRHYDHHMESMKSVDLDPARLTMPVLVVHGTKDRNAPYGGGREWAMRLPNARLVTVPGAAHASWIDNPSLVFGAIRRFLRGEWPREAEKVTSLSPSPPAAPGSGK